MFEEPYLWYRRLCNTLCLHLTRAKCKRLYTPTGPARCATCISKLTKSLVCRITFSKCAKNDARQGRQGIEHAVPVSLYFREAFQPYRCKHTNCTAPMATTAPTAPTAPTIRYQTCRPFRTKLGICTIEYTSVPGDTICTVPIVPTVPTTALNVPHPVYQAYLPKRTNRTNRTQTYRTKRTKRTNRTVPSVQSVQTVPYQTYQPHQACRTWFLGGYQAPILNLDKYRVNIC